MTARFTFKGFADRIEIFKAGTHTDSKGREIEFTTDDLDEMVDTFSAEHPFPYVLGHPKDNDPAYGWAAKVSRDGNSLFIEESQDVNPEFEAACERKEYRNRSVSIEKNGDNKWSIRHLGFLGAVPPAVKGLKPIAFSDTDEASIFEFALDDKDVVRATNASGYAFKALLRMMRSMKNRLIESVGIEKADEEFPEWELEQLNSAGEANTDVSTNPLQRGHMYSTSQLQSVESAGDKDDMGDKTKVNFSQADIDAARQKAAQEARDAAQAEFAHTQTCKAIVDQCVDDGRLVPAMANGLAEFMASLDNQTKLTCNFAANDGEEKVELTQFEFMKNMLENIPAQFSSLFEEVADDASDPGRDGSDDGAEFTAPDNMAVDPERAQLDRKIRSFMAKNPEATYIEAARAVA